MNNLQANKTTRIIFSMLIVVFVIMQSYPVFWVTMASLKSPEDIAGSAPYALPQSIYFGNYVKAFTQSGLIRYFMNSVIVAVCTLLGIIILSAPAAYAISKIEFKQSGQVMSFFLLGMMIPIFSCLIPMFQIYNLFNLRNTYLSVILPQVGFSLPMSIFLYVGFMKYIPNELMEAAAIDGAGSFRIFSKVIFPMAKNSTVTVMIYNFVSIWNEFTYANTFMTKDAMKTLPIGLNAFVGEMGRRDWGATFAAIVIAILPTILIYFVLNKQVMEGMAAGAVKS